jgi:hypothetical protein
MANHDRSILRRLTEQVADVAALPAHQETIAGWKRLNDLQPGKPMLYIYQIPWHEMDVDGELALQCKDAFCRRVEQQLRRTLYQWRHLPGDMVVEPEFGCPPVVHETPLGLEEQVDIVQTDARSDIVSRHFHGRIREEADLEIIQTPRVTFDAEATEANCRRLSDLFGDILPVRKDGMGHMGYAPWDWLVCCWGVEEALADLAERPELAHAAMGRLTNAWLARLDQLESLNLLDVNKHIITGQGGLGYTDELPPKGCDPAHVRCKDIWGGAMSQIFSAVSPRMHEEFALQYEARFLNRFGLCYYGCCEPLDLKVDILRRNLPRLRKISMSPWVDVERGARAIGQDFVFSYKPNPAALAGDDWSPEQVRQDLRAVLEETRGCHVEIILKDISTVRYRPQRLWEWARVASQVATEFA